MGSRRLRHGFAAAVLVACGLLCYAGAACSSRDRTGGGADDAAAIDNTNSADAGEVAPRLPTYTGVYDQVLLPNCASPFCHAGSGDYFQLATMAIGYASLADAAAQGPDCAKTGLKRVEPGHPETSLLYLKITRPPCGTKMPRFYGDGGSLKPAEIEQVRQWIALGARND